MNNVIIIIKDVIDINIKPIILDISKKNDDVLTTKKGDGRSRFLFFKLLDKSVPLDLTEKKLICYLVKPDSKKVLNYLVVNDAKKGYCTLELTNQVLAAAGVANLELMITKEDKKLTTIPLKLEVVKYLKDGFVESAHEFNALMDCLASIEKWDNDFADKIGKIEELYTTRLNGIDASLEEINNKIDICPDDFSGTDSQKIQSAFNYCINNNGINNIKLNRKYDITGSEIMFEVDSFWRFISFEGGEIVKNDEGFIFNSTLSGNGRNSPKFTKTIITTNADNVYLYNGNKMIRQYCDNVVFRKVGCIKTTSYLQTLRLHNCEIGQLGCNFIDADNCFDCEIVHCRFESSTKFNAIKIQTNGEGISYFGLRIKNNLLEGYVYTTPIVIGIGYGLDISTNYFEANNTSLIIDNNGEKSTLVSGNIENNVFGGNKSDYDIFISSKVNTHRLTLLKCTTNASVGKYLCNIYLIKDYIDTNNCYAGGKICPDTSVRSVRNSSFKVTQNDLGVGGISFEIPLNIKNNGNIASLFNRQYLVTINATFGSSVWYKAHLVGILSIDGQYIKGEVKHELLFTILSTRNTSGNNNGSVENKAVYSYYFKETMTKLIDPSASVAAIVFEFSALKYNTSNNCNFKGINSIIQQYEEDM